MMTCKELAELLQDFLDGELPKEYSDLICHHLRECGPCINFLESYKVTVTMCRKLPPLEMPVEMKERLQAAVREFEEKMSGGSKNSGEPGA
ncbi:MAG: zf-HC2 domain-containing protein [Planctomycetes bacterium]|nr:zf-HC2 domain-containing protein [Planctomycetota bacterium]